MVTNIGVTHPEYIMVAMTSSSGDTTTSKVLGSHTHSSGKEEAEVGPVVATKDVPVSGSASEEEGKGSDGGVATAEEQATVVSEEGKEGGGGAKSGEEAGRRGVKHNGDIGRRKSQEKGSVEKESSASEELLQPTIQALAVLSNVRVNTLLCESVMFSLLPGFGTLH